MRTYKTTTTDSNGSHEEDFFDYDFRELSEDQINSWNWTDRNKQISLDSCPFCGWKGILAEDSEGFFGWCSICGCKSRHHWNWISAAKIWNNRTLQTVVEETGTKLSINLDADRFDSLNKQYYIENFSKGATNENI